MTTIALLGATGLYLLFIWLASAIAASWLSDRKGYGEKPGLATGLLLSAIGVAVWLVWPPRAASRWKVQGAIPRRGGEQMTVAEQLAAQSEAAASGKQAPEPGKQATAPAKEAPESATEAPGPATEAAGPSAPGPSASAPKEGEQKEFAPGDGPADPA